MKAWLKASLKAGDELAFSVVDDDGSRKLSHQVAYRRRAYVVTGLDGEALGEFATLDAAMRAGFAASHEALDHGIG